MDNMNPNQMPPMGMIPEQKSGKGPLIAVIIILILIVIGSLYFLKQRNSQMKYTPQIQSESDEVTASLKAQSSSDELDSIEADLKSSNYDNLDQGAAALQAEL